MFSYNVDFFHFFSIKCCILSIWNIYIDQKLKLWKERKTCASHNLFTTLLSPQSPIFPSCHHPGAIFISFCVSICGNKHICVRVNACIYIFSYSPFFDMKRRILYTLFCILLFSVVFYIWVSSSVKWEEHCVKSRQMEAHESLTAGSDTEQLPHPVLTTHSYCSTQQQMATDTPMTSCWHCKLKHS